MENKEMGWEREGRDCLARPFLWGLCAGGRGFSRELQEQPRTAVGEEWPANYVPFLRIFRLWGNSQLMPLNRTEVSMTWSVAEHAWTVA